MNKNVDYEKQIFDTLIDKGILKFRPIEEKVMRSKKIKCKICGLREPLTKRGGCAEEKERCLTCWFLIRSLTDYLEQYVKTARDKGVNIFYVIKAQPYRTGKK